MGNWKLEAFKMAIYMSFPVSAFILFNSPHFYEKTLFEFRQEVDRWTTKDKHLEEYTKLCQKINMEKKLKALEMTTPSK